MANDLNSELHRTLMLHALKGADPRLLKTIMSDKPDESKVLSGLRQHNDLQHSQLMQRAGIKTQVPSRSDRVTKMLEENGQ